MPNKPLSHSATTPCPTLRPPARNRGRTLCIDPLELAGADMHFLIFIFGLYFLPAIIAAIRHTHNATAVLLIDLFLGWTFVGWVIAMVLAIFSAPYYVHYYRRGW